MTTFSIKQPLASDGGMTGDGRFEPIAAARFGYIEWLILVKEAFRALSGLTVSVRSGLSYIALENGHLR